nr:M23 family metallopeptidase [Micromonospora craterilacus]
MRTRMPPLRGTLCGLLLFTLPSTGMAVPAMPGRPPALTTSPSRPPAEPGGGGLVFVGGPAQAGGPSPAAGQLAVGGAPAPGTAGPFRWPVDGAPNPVRRFDPPPRPWLSGHRGVDLLALPGATIRAAGAGTVLFAGMVAGRPVVSVEHADGLRTTYEPVQPVVTAGTVVPAGAALGGLLPGHAGCPGDACLHWGLRQGSDYLDPLALVGLGRARLLPLGEITTLGAG